MSAISVLSSGNSVDLDWAISAFASSIFPFAARTAAWTARADGVSAFGSLEYSNTRQALRRLDSVAAREREQRAMRHARRFALN